MMKTSLIKLGISKLTDRFQTTIPTSVRKELGLGKKDFIEFLKADDGHLVLRRAQPEPEQTEEDFPPELLAWLKFIEKDHAARPEQLVVLDDAFFAKAKDLSKGIQVDLDAPLDSDERDI